MHGRVYWIGNGGKYWKGNIIYRSCMIQFSLNSLVPEEMLKMIEGAVSEDPVDLQNGFNAYDECNGKSKIGFLKILLEHCFSV
jgi:hypothetical protein